MLVTTVKDCAVIGNMIGYVQGEICIQIYIYNILCKMCVYIYIHILWHMGETMISFPANCTDFVICFIQNWDFLQTGAPSGVSAPEGGSSWITKVLGIAQVHP